MTPSETRRSFWTDEDERRWQEHVRRYAAAAKVWGKPALQRCPECFVRLPTGMIVTSMKLGWDGAYCPSCGVYFANERELDVALSRVGM